jgi:AAA family ATP:ADP antiporter
VPVVITKNFKSGEVKKFSLLGILFALIVGTYWFLRPIKDGVFITYIGANYLPYAQLVSLLAIVPTLALYSKLVDWLPRHKLFYVLAIIFSSLLTCFTYLLTNSAAGGMCKIGSFGACALGMSFYVFVKMFGSIMVALFWAFVADTTTPNAAKRGYGIIVAIGQLGNIGGSLFVRNYAVQLGAGALSMCGIVSILAIIPLVYVFMRVVPPSNLIGFRANEPKQQSNTGSVGIGQGLKLMLSQPYLLAIFGTIAIYEIVQAVFDFRFKTLASAMYQGNELIQFLGQFGAITGAFALISLLFGVDRIAKRFGLTSALVLFPICMLFLISINVYPSLQVAMWVMIVTRGLNYALNQPTKEQLYIATTKQTKYKAKAWIEVFGTRVTEAMAHSVNMAKASMGSYFVLFSTVIAFGGVGAWILIGLYLGRTYKNAIDKDELVC